MRHLWYIYGIYRSLPSERPPSFIRPPLFFHIERIGIVNVPLLSVPRPPPPLFRSRSRYFASDAPTPCLMKCQNVRDISWGTEHGRLESKPSQCSRYDRRSHCHPVGVAVVVRQWRGSKHFCKHDVPSQRYSSTNCSCSPWPPFAHRRSRHLTAHTQLRTRSAN